MLWNLCLWKKNGNTASPGADALPYQYAMIGFFDGFSVLRHENFLSVFENINQQDLSPDLRYTRYFLPLFAIEGQGDDLSLERFANGDAQSDTRIYQITALKINPDAEMVKSCRRGMELFTKVASKVRAEIDCVLGKDFSKLVEVNVLG